MTLVTVIVKALNEELRIAKCLDAALRAVAGLDAEIILVDSLSTDRTVEVAKDYPVRIIQFADPGQRCCGAAVELGWRHAVGQFVYVLDADMQLQPGFIEQALDFLAQNPHVAAVGGTLIDTRLNTLADRQRARSAKALTTVQQVGELGGGGLYRASAVAQTGYLAHQSLPAYEEAELGARLRARGWSLVRLPYTAVLHEGHDENDLQMFARLWRNGRAQSGAVFLRSALGKPWFMLVLRKLAHIVAVPVLHGLALLLAWALPWPGGLLGAAAVWLGFWTTVLLALGVHKRSLRLATWHLILWHYWAAGTLAGVTCRVIDPLAPIPAHELSPPSPRRPNPHETAVFNTSAA